jgi:Ca2+-transporting ATPase
MVQPRNGAVPDAGRPGPRGLGTSFPGSDAFCAAPASHALAQLGSDPDRGLTQAEAQRRLSRFGHNELSSAPRVPRWRRFVAQLQTPLVLLLLAASVISLGVWWYEGAGHVPYEALTILAIVVANALLGFVQEERAEHAIAALKDMTTAQALVLRDGRRHSVPASEIVPGDLLVVEEGARIGADARLVESISLRTVEAALTGESVPVDKTIEPVSPDAALPDRACMLYSGTAAVYGRGLAVVTATGLRTEIGRIAGLIAVTASPATPLQRQLAKIGKSLGIAAVGIAATVAAVVMVMSPLHSMAELVTVLVFAIALAVAAVPEGLAAVTTVVLSLGMQRMAARNAIVRTLSAVETLGSTTVICTDKTGTLTRNELTVRVVMTASGRVTVSGTGYSVEGSLMGADGAPISAQLHAEITQALTAAHLCNNAVVTGSGEDRTVLGDPTEIALEIAARKAGIEPETATGRFPRIGEIPFSSERKRMSTLHRHGEDVMLVTKGAPDNLLARCSHERVGADDVVFTDQRRAQILHQVEKLAADALRTLGLASRVLPASSMPSSGEAEADLVWLGVVGMIDPPRTEAQDAVREAQQAGVRIIMMTGDHPATAAAIAAELGISAGRQAVVLGSELERLPEARLVERVRHAAVYARVSPEHKLAIVRALHACGEIVAMTGDGVNDAPALKEADIGIAMGVTGTHVAKEAADMVLADDDFSTIVAAIGEGRSIYANIQGFLRFLLATNAGEVLVLFFGVVFAARLGLVTGTGGMLILPLLANQILWINLVTDSFPALAVGVHPADQGLMRAPPRVARAGVITPRMWYGIAATAPVMAAGTLLMLDAGLPGGWIEGDGDVAFARTMAFNTLVLFSLGYAACTHSDTQPALYAVARNRWLLLAVTGSLALQGAVIYIPALQPAFGTVALSGIDWVLCIATSFSLVLAREGLKAWWRGRDRRLALAAAGP